MITRRVAVVVLCVSLCLGITSAVAGPRVAPDVPDVYAQLLSESPVPVIEKGGFLPSFGNWFDLSSPGWGLDIQRVGNLLFVVWFTYRPDGSPIWYVAVGELIGMTWNGTIDVFSWDPMGDPGDQATPTSVGTMTIVWSDENNATVNWMLNGEPGGANISFAQFSTNPTLANMTGHYFPFFASGWGFTLLTQGDVTVMTIYFYRNGEPTWLQGVAPTPGFIQAHDMLYFFGPDLCPSCLASKTAKGPSTEYVLRAEYQYRPGAPADVSFLATDINHSSPLGQNPTGDHTFGFFPNTGSGITSAYQDNFDPDYGGLGDMIQGDCAAFWYRSTIMDPSPVPAGGFDTHYATTQPDMQGRFWVYNDSSCTEPNEWQSPIDSQFYQSYLEGSFTGEIDIGLGSAQINWVSRTPNAFEFGDESCDVETSFSVYASKRATFSGNQLSELWIWGTGVVGSDLLICTDGFREVFSFSRQIDLPLNLDFLDEADDYLMLSISMQF